MFGWLFRKSPIIQEPVLGFLDLSNGAHEHFIRDDKKAFGSLFQSVVDSASAPPQCDVLFVYCNIDGDGKIRRTEMELRDIIYASGARIAVFATINQDCDYMRALRRPGRGRANIVLTLNRKGGAFGTFFHNLFDEMSYGTSMPVAWVKFAPQVPGMEHKDCPVTIFACEAGQVAFSSPAEQRA